MINLLRLKNSFTLLSHIGENDNGGLDRLSYSASYNDAVHWLCSYMEQSGLNVHIDAAGNVIGTYDGINTELPAILCGSHLDSVPNGGAFDGAIGILAGIECIRCWHDERYIPNRTVKIIAFIEEEGTLFGHVCLGSSIMTGLTSIDSLEQLTDKNGIPFMQYIETLSSKEQFLDAFHTENFVKNSFCFLELHVEQGSVLENNQLDLGIVSSIVGITHIHLSFTGIANHSGTTPMNHRSDALAAASSLISYIYLTALAANDKYVATVGKLEVYPNAENVIPGKVNITIEIRSESQAILSSLSLNIQKKCQDIQKQFHVSIEKTKQHNTSPKPMHHLIIKRIKDAANFLNISHKIMPSWAGHDAMIFAQFIPTGMIFIPSHKGISHSPKEFSSWQSIEKVVNTLQITLNKLSST